MRSALVWIAGEMRQETDVDSQRHLQAARLKQAREKCGFKSARSAALRFHWQPETYNKHESGERSISRAVYKYARAFSVDAAWLLGLKEDRADEPTDTLGYLRHLDAKLDRVISDIGDIRTRLSSLEERVTGVEASVVQIHERVDGVQRQLDGISTRLEPD